MPVTPTYPGVYVEEVPSGVRTITGVATSIAAFIDFFKMGPIDEAVQIFSPADFERIFGGLHHDSLASYAIYQFFLNGGTNCYVVRTASGNPTPASVTLLSANGGEAFTLEARNPGVWGNGLRADVEYPEPDDGVRFNLLITLTETQDGRTTVVASEVFRNLTLGDEEDSRFVRSVIDDRFAGSKLVTIRGDLGTERPAQTGTLSGLLPETLSIEAEGSPRFSILIGTDGPYQAQLEPLTDASPPVVARTLENAIRSVRPTNRAFSQATVTAVNNRLRIKAGPILEAPPVSLPVTFSSFEDTDVEPAETDETATKLGLTESETLIGLLSGELSNDHSVTGVSNLQIRIGDREESITMGSEDQTLGLQEIRDELQNAIRGIEAAPESFTNARVAIHEENGVNRLILLSGTPGTLVTVTPTESDDTAVEMRLSQTQGQQITATVSDNVTIAGADTLGAINVSIGEVGPRQVDLGLAVNSVEDLPEIASRLQDGINEAEHASWIPWFADARVTDYTSETENKLIVLSGFSSGSIVFGPAPPLEDGQTDEDLQDEDLQTVSDLQLGPDQAETNVQIYQFGAGPAVPGTAQGAGDPGVDGGPPDADALRGSAADKTGVHALLDVDLFNILCIPRVAELGPDQANAVIAWATNLCEDERAFFIADLPCDIDEVPEVRERMNAGDIERHRNVAVYFPCVEVPDPLNEFRPRRLPPSGTMAGLYARTDATRGVWKAPAGIEATLRGVQGLAYKMTDAENGVLNPLGINCLRNFPVIGNVSWGARTLRGADQLADEWKYIPVRRLALFLEESLFRGTQWVVFEPNDEPLWSQIRLNVGAFMNNLFRQGAFQGQTPREAYLVKCDSETTTQNDINLGIVNIVVGFAPLKPAEFVILKIQQLAGQIET